MKKVCALAFVLILLVPFVGCSGGSSGSFGEPDPSFGSNGFSVNAINSGNDTGLAVAMQSDGKIVVAGCSVLGGKCKFGLMRTLEDGTLDSTFGDQGRLTTVIGQGEDGAYAVAMQSDGKIVAAGATFNGTDKDIALVRYNGDGSLDKTFGNGTGIVTSAIGAGDDSANAVAIQTDGKIVVAGCSFVGSFCKFLMARYLSDGSPDSSFGQSGHVTTSIGEGEDGAYGMVLQPDGKIVAAGATFNGANKDIALVRYNQDGSLDSSFGGGDGIVTSAIGEGNDVANSVALQPDGKIVIAGCAVLGANCKVVVARYLPSGEADPSFSGGHVTTSAGNGEDGAYGVTLQADGKIVIAGATFNGNNKDCLLVRYEANGELDLNFGEQGIARKSVGDGDDVANSVTLDSQGRIVAAGYSVTGSNSDFLVVRYL